MLVFTGVVWLTQAVRLIDTVVASGQSARVFLEFSALVLPQVFVIVLPLAGIGAALYALDRLYSESELDRDDGRRAVGRSAMLRPVAIFGALIGLAMAVVLMVLVPRSGATLAERTQAIRSDLANALIVERQFLHPVDGPDAVHHRHRPRRARWRASSSTTSATSSGRSPIRRSARCWCARGWRRGW